ncbi:MAG: protein nirF [Alphaproteobacteria bacterium]|nr:protein nirF [Alphaproteobacteria bacterium]
MRKIILFAAAALALAPVSARADGAPRGTGDLGIVIERAQGSVQVVETTGRTSLGRVTGLGDLSHATAVFSRDGRYAYVFGRDGGLTKVDLLRVKIEKRIIQSGNSIGGAMSQDGRLIAVANYTPGGVKVFDSRTLDPVADIPATAKADGTRSKVVGLADLPGQKFVFTLYDTGEIWVADLADPAKPAIIKFKDVGKLPYDALVTPDGRHYIAGLFGEDGLALLDLWAPEMKVRRILPNYGQGAEKLPVYKMPHLRGWAKAGDKVFLPAIGRHEVLAVDARTYEDVGRIPVHGQPVFAMARPDGRHVWVNFAHPLYDTLQVIDTVTMKVVHTFQPGRAVLHMEFTPKGEHVWVSLRDEDRVDIFDTASFRKIGSIPADKPSGILFAARANRIGL